MMEPGHIISAGDYALVQSNFGNTGQPGINGDFNLDGVVSAADFGYIQSHLGESVYPQTISITVPEPATILVMSIGLAGLLRDKQKKITISNNRIQ